MEEKQIRIGLRLPQELKDEFSAVCKERCINQSELIRSLIVNWLEETKKTK